MSGTPKLICLSMGYTFLDPDDSPVKVSEYQVTRRSQQRIPTTIPTKCRYSSVNLSKNSLSRQELRHFCGTTRYHRPEDGYRAKSLTFMSGFCHSAMPEKAIRAGIRTLRPDGVEPDQI